MAVRVARASVSLVCALRRGCEFVLVWSLNSRTMEAGSAAPCGASFSTTLMDT